MQKADCLKKLEEYKDRPVVIGGSDQGETFYGNLDGHWLFDEDNFLVEVKTNTMDGTYNFNIVAQTISPFVVTCMPYETINYVKAFSTTDPKDIHSLLKNMTPIGTAKSKDEIIKEIESSTVRKACSVRGHNENTEYGGPYGTFNGSIISTERNGVPQKVKDDLL